MSHLFSFYPDLDPKPNNLKLDQAVVTLVLFFLKENEVQKMFLAISRKITSPHEVTTLGITLGISVDDVTYYVTNFDVRDAAYKFLCWTEESYGPEEKWEKIIEALKTLEKNKTIKELGLEERLATFKRSTPVENSVHELNNNLKRISSNHLFCEHCKYLFAGTERRDREVTEADVHHPEEEMR